MKRIVFSLVLAVCSLSAMAGVEYGYFALNPSDGVTEVILNEGDRMIILSSYQSAGASAYAAEFAVELPSGNTVMFSTLNLGLATDSASATRPGIEEDRTLVGPCTVSLKQPANVLYASFKVIRLDVVVEASPMNIIALPADNNGDVDLLIETSPDLITWTPVYSGSAGTSNSAAFFRTRLIQN